MSKKTALTVHESFASNVAYGDSILWDAYTPEQFDLFKSKLKELFRDPDDSKASKAMEKLRENVYNSTIAQTKYTNKNLLSTFILVTVAKGTTYTEAKDADSFSVHLVVRTRKCIKKDNSTDCCMVFIDECGNVYRNWMHFIETNTLPEGVAFAPAFGVYTYSKDTLNMDAWPTPASGLGSKIMTGADYAAGIGGFGAAAITLAAVCTVPISAPIMAGAAIVGLGAGVFTAARSGFRLWTRSDHEQSIALTDKEARNCWLGVGSGALAVSSAAATRSLSALALAGKEVSLFHEAVVNGMNISTMLISGTGVANGILDLYLKRADDEEITALEVAQLAASLVIFTHSVYNFRLASTIVSQTQDARVNSYRNELSSRQRKMFDKLTKETIRTRGSTSGKTDVIRLINEVPDKQYLNDLHKSNKNLNQNKIRFAAGKGGTVVLNEDISVKPSDLRNNIQLNKGQNILGSVKNPIPESHSSISNRTIDLTSIAFYDNSDTLLVYCRTAFNIGSHLIFSAETFQDCVRFLIETVGNDVTNYLIRKAREFIGLFEKQIEELIKTTLFIDKVLFDLYNQAKKFIVDLSIETLEEQIPEIFKSLLEFYEKMSCDDTMVKSFTCDICKGVYRITNI